MNDLQGHISLERLVTLALRGETDPHLSKCSFCREQLAFLRDLEDEVQEDGQFEAPGVFRLAAATHTDSGSLDLRRTWYLEDDQALVRVFEDRMRHLLIGSLLVDPKLYGVVRLRFSGLDREFIPDKDGRFDIGPSGIDIEPMAVTLSFPLH